MLTTPALATRALVFVVIGTLTASACSRPTAVVSPPIVPVPAAAKQLSNDIRWFRNSAEYRALARQAYQVAASRLPELTRGLRQQAWAVILDADETVLDNSEYQRRRFMIDSGYTEASWAKWVNERAATAVPGAAEFTREIHSLGGRVAIVTNRADSLCAATRANLQSAAIEADVVLCQPRDESDKNPRFQRVENGTAASGVPALTVVAWFGDNIQDFPGMTQTVRNDPRAFADFGKRYFIVPNPMYGSWQSLREP